MADPRAELVDIDEKGVARPVGDVSLLRMQGRQGRFSVAPSPSHLLVMRKVEEANGLEGRPCLLSGEIRSPGALCDIVGFVGHAGWKGELLVLEPSSSRSLFFDQGHVVGAQSTVQTERLGEVLYRYGVLDEEQVRRCSDATATGAVRFGEAAVKFGFVSRERLFSLAARQIEEIFYGVLLVTGGMFYFLDSYEDASLSIRQKLSVTALIREGVRRMHEARYFRARIPTIQYVPVRAPGRSAPEADPLRIHPTIDGVKSVADLCRTLGQGEFEVSRGLFQLIQSGHIVMKPPRLIVKAVVEVYNQAIALILRELDAIDEGDAIREQLVAFAGKGTEYQTLFAGAGPSDDGTLDTARITENLTRLGDAKDAEDKLAQVLYEYASYALFLARPHLQRGEDAKVGGTDASGSKRLSQRIKTMLEPIASAATEASARAPKK
jgi:hypothetical protein